MARPAAGGNLRVGYRSGLSDGFTTIDSFTADGATYIFNSEEIGLINLDDIQIQVEMNDSNIGSIDMELVEIRLFP